MPVGDEEVALILVLQFDPVAERTMEIAEMQRAGRSHAGKHAPGRLIGAHAALVAWRFGRLCVGLGTS